MEFFPRQISKNESKDTGMAMVLICLLIGWFSRSFHFVSLGIILLIINMVVPSAYRPVAKIWLGISRIMGFIMSKFLLTIIFFGMVVPMAFIRKLAGADTLKLKKWRQGNSSVFTVREHLFRPEDVDKPY